MQPPPTLSLALCGLHDAGASAPSGNRVHFAIVQPSTQGPPGAFAQWIASQPGPGVLPYGSQMGAGRVMNQPQSQPLASSGQGHRQTGAARIVQNPQSGVQHLQMVYISPLSGRRFVAVQLHSNIHIRTAPYRNCTYQYANVALPVVVNAICDHRYPGWGHVTLPCGLFRWVLLQ